MTTQIAITWPKTKPLQTYLDELAGARRRGDVINYHVAGRPRLQGVTRVYVVYENFIRGWSTLHGVVRRSTNEVRDADGGTWPAGWYIVREPDWNPIEPVPMLSFRGHRFIAQP